MQRVKTNWEVCLCAWLWMWMCVFAVVCVECLRQTVIVPNENVGPLSLKAGDCYEL